MYYNVSFMGQDPMNFYVSMEETDETVSYETYQLYMSGQYIKGNDGEPKLKEQTNVQSTSGASDAVIQEDTTPVVPDLPNIDPYVALNNKIKKLRKQMEDIPTSADNIYRVAHGEFIPIPIDKKPSDFVYEIISVQVSGDTFNSPNVGMILQPPQYPFYRDANIIIGIVNINQVYVSNNETDPTKHITGWLTVKVNEKTNVPQDTNGQPLVVTSTEPQ
jgi:hypothetical protein|nr:MAG TPA: hypothetical protein [Caudoviricetes sp.]